ncbi:vesicle-associated membrane protein 3-like [Mantella aurantiaca]
MEPVTVRVPLTKVHQCDSVLKIFGNHRITPLVFLSYSEQGLQIGTKSNEGSCSGGLPPSSNRRLLQTQAQVNEVVDIMRVNVDKVLDRDQKLSELDNRADALQAGASQFETSAAKLKRKYWWKNCKMMIVMGLVCALMFIILIIYFCT